MIRSDTVRAAYVLANREKLRAYKKAWDLRNRAKMRAYFQALHVANREERNAYRRAWYAANQVRQDAKAVAYIAAHREARTVYCRAYAKQHAAKWNAFTAKYRAAKLRATPVWADQNAIRSVYAESVRLTKTTGQPHHVDHYYPLVSPLVCGLHVAANLQILTKTANLRKHNKHPDRMVA